MKLGIQSTPVELGGELSAPKAFQIKASKEAFAILSSGLYNDKILAIIRELSCNAYDAHVAAGKRDLPFDLHLPTILEPVFSIKDYGVGLSHDQVMDLYCTYFGSNKSDSNEFVGALGLGSKSPFCYTEGFTVVSRYQAMTRTYAAYLSEEGTPTVVLQTEEDTPEEPNGLEITFPCKQSDIREFESKAASALEFFDPLPNLNTRITVVKSKYKLRTTRWGWREEKGYENNGLRAIQGMVKYAVGNIDESRMDDHQKSVAGMPIDIFFPIGELSVAVSRETLSNDERTIGNILKALSEIGTGFEGEIKKKIEACKTSWEAKALIYDLINTELIGKFVNGAYRDGKFDGKYTNFNLSHVPLILNELDYSATSMSTFTTNSNYSPQATKNTFFYSAPDKRAEYRADVETGKRTKEHYNQTINTESDVLFVIGDVPFGGEKYIHYFLKSSDDNRETLIKKKVKRVYLIHRVNKDVSTDAVIREAKKILTALGDPPQIYLSEWKTKYKDHLTEPKTATPSVKRDIVYFNTSGDINRCRQGYERKGWLQGWQTPGKLPDGTKYYVILKGLEPINTGFEWAESFGNFIKNVRQVKEIPFNTADIVYGLPETSSFLKNNKGEWVEFVGWVFTKLKEIMTPKKEVQLSLQIKGCNIGMEETLKYLVDKNLLAENNSLRKFAVDYFEAKKYDKDSMVALNYLVNMATNRKLYNVTNAIDFEKRWKEAKADYPLLDFVREPHRYDTSDVKQMRDNLVHYLKLVDEEKARKLRDEAQLSQILVYSNNQEEDITNVT